MDTDRRILIVAYDFPPIASAGMARIVGMVRALRTRGWDVTVLTVRDSFVRQSPENVAMVPSDVRVVRTWSVDLSLVATRFRSRAATMRRRGRLPRLLAGLMSPLVWLSRLLSGIERHAWWPDRKAGWFVPLLLTAGRLIRRGNYDVVLSSSPPHSSLLPLLLMRSFRSFKWVVDFRDPWTTPSRTRRVERVQRVVEARVLARADAVIANTQGNKMALLATFPSLLDEKVTVITNGFDTDLRNGPECDEADVLDCDLVYTGHIYPGMLDPFLGALAYLREKGEPVPTVWVYGVRPQHLRIDESLRDRIVFKERVSFVESLTVMGAAPALLFLVPHGPGFETWVPSKLYPYLFSGRPVFALVPEGDAARILQETGAGSVVRSEEPREVAAELRDFLDGVVANPRRGRDDDVRRNERLAPYAWSTLGARLDALLRAEAVRA